MLGTATSTWGFTLSSVNPITSTISVMLISAVKAALVMFFFMELRHAPKAWQLAATIWVAITCAVVISIYLL